MSEIDAGQAKGFQTFNSKDKLLYAWQENTETAITVSSEKYLEKFVEIIDADHRDTILGIACKSIVVKSQMGQMTLWYNSDYFKMDAKLYQGHKYGHWDQILNKINCLPLKIEQKGFMGNITQLAIDYKEIPVDIKQFDIPAFKEVIENPMN